MAMQKEEFQLAFQKVSDETSAALQLLKGFTPEIHQQQVEAVFNKIYDYTDATKRTSERVDKLASEFL